MKLKSKEVAAIKTYLKQIQYLLEYGDDDGVKDYIGLIWDILERNNDKDNEDSGFSYEAAGR